MQGVGKLAALDDYLSGRRNRVNSRRRGSGSWIRRWKAGGRRRRMRVRQAFRQQFILHRTETEATGYPQGKAQDTGLHDAAPRLASEGRKDTRACISGPSRHLCLWSPAGLSGSWLHFLLQLFRLSCHTETAAADPCPRPPQTPELMLKALALQLGMKWQLQTWERRTLGYFGADGPRQGLCSGRQLCQPPGT